MSVAFWGLNRMRPVCLEIKGPTLRKLNGSYRPTAVIRCLHKPGLFTSGLGGEWRVSVTVTLGLHDRRDPE